MMFKYVNMIFNLLKRKKSKNQEDVENYINFLKIKEE